MNMRKISWSDWKKQMTKEMESDPMFAPSKDVKPAKGLKVDGDKMTAEEYSAYQRNWMNENTND